MLRFLPGVFIVQLVTAVLLWINLDATPRDMALQFGVPVLLITVVTGLWFSSIARAEAERANAKVRLAHAQEREKMQLSAEKSKAKIIEKTHKEIRKQEKRIGRKANLKVGLAFMGASVAGVIMLISELITFGLMTIMTTVGGLGGYLVRARQNYDVNNSGSSDAITVIDHTKEPARISDSSQSQP